MLGFGYYTQNNPDEQLDTWETPWPVAFPSEPWEPVPGWGMNPLLAGPPVIAVGADAPPVPDIGPVLAQTQATKDQTQQIWTAVGVLIVGAFIFDALKRDKTARAKRFRRRA
jgi:hypothetical protein